MAQAAQANYEIRRKCTIYGSVFQIRTFELHVLFKTML